jgi:hypothetical protein
MSISFDEHSDMFSRIARDGPGWDARQSLRDLIQDDPALFLRHFRMLPGIDYDIARFYYVQKLSQDQISRLLSITQAAVSRRLKYILTRVKFLLKQPTLDPIEAREDFLVLFPPQLFEFAYFFFWEHAQNRVKFFIQTSQSGAANKFGNVLAHIQKEAERPDAEIEDIDDPDEYEDALRRKFLANTYYDYFQASRKKDNVVTWLFKKNDSQRVGSLVQGESVLGEFAAPLGSADGLDS